ncbi:Protein FAR1-RELATED SEQUENCE 11, partial [Bienertia sinuspersici]
TFASVMKKAAKTIITDQGPWICEAILAEMPATKHRLCIWHITLKFSCWFVALLHNEYQKWCSVFYMLYKMTSPEEDIICSENFEHRLIFVTNFFGGIIITGRSASINAFIKKFVSSRTCLTEFVKHEISQERSRNKVIATLRPVSLQTNPPLEKQAFEVLTPFSLKKFQEELARCTSYIIMKVDANECIVTFFEGDMTKHQKLFWDGYTILFSCKNFELWGKICRHILRVFCQRDCFMVPP